MNLAAWNLLAIVTHVTRQKTLRQRELQCAAEWIAYGSGRQFSCLNPDPFGTIPGRPLDD